MHVDRFGSAIEKLFVDATFMDLEVRGGLLSHIIGKWHTRFCFHVRVMCYTVSMNEKIFKCAYAFAFAS